MNATDIGKPMVGLHPTEVERLLSWLKCYPVAGREDERKSLECVLETSRSLSEQVVTDIKSDGSIVCDPPPIKICQLTVDEVCRWLVIWIRANTIHRKFSIRGANVSAQTWAKAAKAFADWLAFYAVENERQESTNARV